MDLSLYPNILSCSAVLGKTKQTRFNKKRQEEAQRAWDALTPEELARINEEISSAKRVQSALVMPTAIVYRNVDVLSVIPARDIVWMYGHILTSRMNFIPYSKTHTTYLITRQGIYHTIGVITTGPFTKKRPCDEAIDQIKEVLAPRYKGILYGWTVQLQKAVSENFAEVVSFVDAKNNE